MVVCEGAQGALLDEWWGFHPHTTWSDRTPRGALDLLGQGPTTRLGLTRAYAIRHGPGPLPTFEPGGPPEAHNSDEGWQGPVRTGPLDLVLLRYAVEVRGGLDGLALTCLDRVEDPVRVCTAYRLAGGAHIDRLEPGERTDLAHREALGRLLGEVEPQNEQVEKGALPSRLRRRSACRFWC